MGTRMQMSVFALLILSVSATAAQASGWMRLYGTTRSDAARSIDRTSDGGFVMAASRGQRLTSSPWPGLWLAKLDSAGELQWERQFSNLQFPNRVRQTADGGYIVVGETLDDDYEAWVLKTDQSGGLEWQLRFDEARSDGFNDVVPIDDGGYLLVGVTNSNPFGRNGATPWIVRIDASGEVLWQRTYETEAGTLSANAAQPLSGVGVSGGGFLLVGYAKYFSCASHYGCDGGWLAKIGADGALQWSKVLGYDDISPLSLRDVAATGSGDYLAVGSHQRTRNSDVWLVRVTGAGVVSHQAALGTEEDSEWAQSIVRTADDGFVLGAGTYDPETAERQIWLLRLGAGTDARWGARFGTHAFIGGALETADEAFVVTGSALDGAGGVDAVLARYEEPSGPPHLRHSDCYMGARTNVPRVTTGATERALGITQATPHIPLRSPFGFEEPPDTVTMTDFPCPRRCPPEVAGGILDDLERCVAPPLLPNGLPGRCPPVGCPDCAYRLTSDDPRVRPLPDAQFLYRLLPRLLPEGTTSVPPELLKELDARMKAVPLEACQGASADPRPTEAKPTSPTIAELRQDVGACLNAIEVAALRPRTVSQRFERVGQQTAELAGIAQLRFDNQSPGGVRLAVRDCPPRIRPPYEPIWPRIAYELTPVGGLADIPIDIDLFVGGLGFMPGSTTPLILSWDGRSWRPLPTTSSPDGKRLRAQLRGASTLTVATTTDSKRGGRRPKKP
jgi:hypothetical protein